MNSPFNLSIKPTLDGSNTIFDERIGEAYHSMNGAFQESDHVFVVNGLIEYLNRTQKTSLSILEIGFGTGLNFLGSAEYCIENGIDLLYIGVENNFPGLDLLKQLNYQDKFPAAFTVLENTLLNTVKATEISVLQLKLINQTAQETNYNQAVDLVFFDAFAPASQPEMWESDLITKIAARIIPNGFFISYSITGKTKEILRKAGFKIERPKGAAGKRQMLRAVKLFDL